MKKVRVWQLGSLEYKIFPSTEALENFADMLEKAWQKEDDIVDLVVGPDIKVSSLDVGDSVYDFTVYQQELSEDGMELTIKARKVQSL